MRIAMVHSFYTRAQPSGENRVVEDQVDALAAAGHDVLLISQDTDALQGRLYGATTALNVMRGTGHDPSAEVKAFRPDVVHIQNLHPNFSTRWVEGLGVPTVLSVHNYRPFCSNGLLFRDGAVCLECPTSGNQHAVVHGCFRESRLATVPLALSRGSYRRRVLKSVDAVVTTSELSDRVYRDLGGAGLPTVMIPNFGPDGAAEAVPPSEPRSWIALGRFSPEKGFLELLAEWPSSERLTIVGDGPLVSEVRAQADLAGVEIHSSMPREVMRERLARSFALVFPSRWFESDPQVVVEAMRLGVPVVAYHVNAAAELVAATGSGAVYGHSVSLDEAIGSVIRDRELMSSAATHTFESRWTRQAWLRAVEDLYRRVLVAAR